MLIVAPTGRTNLVTRLSMPRFSSRHRNVTGNVPALKKKAKKQRRHNYNIIYTHKWTKAEILLALFTFSTSTFKPFLANFYIKSTFSWRWDWGQDTNMTWSRDESLWKCRWFFQTHLWIISCIVFKNTSSRCFLMDRIMSIETNPKFWLWICSEWRNQCCIKEWKIQAKRYNPWSSQTLEDRKGYEPQLEDRKRCERWLQEGNSSLHRSTVSCLCGNSSGYYIRFFKIKHFHQKILLKTKHTLFFLWMQISSTSSLP